MIFHNISKLTTIKNRVEMRHMVLTDNIENNLWKNLYHTQFTWFTRIQYKPEALIPVASFYHRVILIVHHLVSPKVPKSILHTSYNRQRVVGNLIQTSILIFKHLLRRKNKNEQHSHTLFIYCMHIITGYPYLQSRHNISSQWLSQRIEFISPFSRYFIYCH